MVKATKSEAKRNKPGRPAYKPTTEGRKFVGEMCAGGLTIIQISRVMGIGKDCLQRHFKEELATSRIYAHARVAQTAYEMAVSGEYPVMTIWWTKCQMGWREPEKVLPERPPIRIIERVIVDVAKGAKLINGEAKDTDRTYLPAPD